MPKYMLDRAGDNWLLVTDVDGTLVGDDASLRRFVALVRGAPGLRVALNSSRPIISVQRTLDVLALNLTPCAIIGAMGTEISLNGVRDTVWTSRFDGWDRVPVDAVMARLGFAPHADEFQTPYKASFAVPGGAGQRRAAEAIEATGLAAQIVCSGTSDFDVLPRGADKGDATLYVAAQFGVATDRLVVAGDSANDLSMFEVAEKGIVVGNARDELRCAVGTQDACFARSPCAAGLIEGLRHFGVPLPDALETN